MGARSEAGRGKPAGVLGSWARGALPHSMFASLPATLPTSIPSTLSLDNQSSRQSISNYRGFPPRASTTWHPQCHWEKPRTACSTGQPLPRAGVISVQSPTTLIAGSLDPMLACIWVVAVCQLLDTVSMARHQPDTPDSHTTHAQLVASPIKTRDSDLFVTSALASLCRYHRNRRLILRLTSAAQRYICLPNSGTSSLPMNAQLPPRAFLGQGDLTFSTHRHRPVTSTQRQPHLTLTELRTL